MDNSLRCVNLDWLEVFCYEPVGEPHTADYFRSCGLFVRERDYGTRVYAQMFVIEDQFGDPFCEIRRAPKSDLTNGGILAPNATHIRLVNRYCYHQHAAQLMKDFLARHNYTDIRISRVDIALDFVMFDSGDLPEKFLERFMKGRYCKINQANIHSHGRDGWGSRVWNSVSWGNAKSQIGTKFYNKSLELRQVKDKPYIRQAWFTTKLISDPQDPLRIERDGTPITPEVWRVEFSISSSVKGWYTIEKNGVQKNFHSYRNNLDCYTDRQKLWTVWASLADHYFHFKYYQEDARKDRCPDKKLFDLLTPCEVYHVERLNSSTPASSELQQLLKMLRHYRMQQLDVEVQSSIDLLIQKLEDEFIREDGGSGFTRAQIRAMQIAIAAKYSPLSWFDFIETNFDDIF